MLFNGQGHQYPDGLHDRLPCDLILREYSPQFLPVIMSAKHGGVIHEGQGWSSWSSVGDFGLRAGDDGAEGPLSPIGLLRRGWKEAGGTCDR